MQISLQLFFNIFVDHFLFSNFSTSFGENQLKMKFKKHKECKY